MSYLIAHWRGKIPLAITLWVNLVTLLVVALFFALITLERIGLYAVLKALGAGTKDLMAGISAWSVFLPSGTAESRTTARSRCGWLRRRCWAMTVPAPLKK